MVSILYQFEGFNILISILGGQIVFRSPEEFAFHAAWLMTGMGPDPCSCKYCDPAVSQRVLNERRERIRRRTRRRLVEARVNGNPITREVNAMNRTAFLRGRRSSN
jgi:hypothetical protein